MNRYTLSVRMAIMLLIFVALTILLVTRIASLAVEDGGRHRSIDRRNVSPVRAEIVDRNGIVLARTITTWSIGIRPRALVNDPSVVVAKLANALGEHEASYYDTLLKSRKVFIYLRHRATPEVVAAVKAIREPAMTFDREPQPQGTLAAHVLGRTSMSRHGVSGMERTLDTRLLSPRGEPAFLSIDSRVQSML